MKRNFIVVIIFFFVSNYTLAQDSLTMAKSAMLNAETYYGKNELTDAWGFTDQAIKYLGKTNSRIQYLRVKICLAKASKDNSKWGVADIELKKFFAVTKEGEYNEEKYNEMLESIALIDKQLSYYKAEQTEWENALSLNSELSYNSYTENYPQGIHIAEAKELINKVILLIGLKDVDGNLYKVVKINKQIWMAENLATTKYNDGTKIELVENRKLWKDLTTPGYCWYNNDTLFKPAAGALYNWYTVNTQKLCPVGWHVPTEADWKSLINFLGGELVAAKKLKINIKDKMYNSSGFSSVFGGYRDGFVRDIANNNSKLFGHIGSEGNY